MALSFTGGKNWSDGDIANGTNLNSIVSGMSYSGTLEVAKGGTAATSSALARVSLNQGVTELTDAATIATNCALNNVFKVTLGGNRTLGAPTNQADGSTYIWRFIQDGTGGRTLAYNAVFKFPGGVDPILSTSAGAVDVMSAVSDGTNLYCSMLLGFA